MSATTLLTSYLSPHIQEKNINIKLSHAYMRPTSREEQKYIIPTYIAWGLSMSSSLT